MALSCRFCSQPVFCALVAGVSGPSPACPRCLRPVQVSLSLAEVAGELDGETLRRLKRECGGLQTLLRNSPQVFRVVDGRVCIRDWREERPRKEKEPEAEQRLFSGAFKTRICWFFAHHPDGCVLPPDRCPFAHGPGELRPAPARKKRPALSAAAARPVGPGVGGPRPEGTVPAP